MSIVAMESHYINFIPELLRVFEIFSNFERQRGVYLLAYKKRKVVIKKFVFHYTYV